MCRRANACCNCNKIYGFLTTQHRISSHIYCFLTCDGRQWDLDDSLENIFSASQYRATANILICSELLRHRSKNNFEHSKILHEWNFMCFGWFSVNQFIWRHVQTQRLCVAHFWSVKIISSRKCRWASNDIVIHVFFINFMVDEKYLTYSISGRKFTANRNMPNIPRTQLSLNEWDSICYIIIICVNVEFY